MRASVDGSPIGRFQPRNEDVQHSQTNSSDFSGLWIPLVTPFAADGGVDHGALAAMTKRLAKSGIAGFVACGSTGEAAALDETEQLAVLDTVLKAADGRPVAMGVSGYHLPKMLDWVDRLTAGRPLAGLLVPAPHYIRPSQAGIAQWFRAIADASPVPVIVYDIPYRTGARIERDTLLQLASHPRIQAVKDCGGDAAKTQALIADGRLQVLAGEDAQIFGTVAAGGAGAIAASAHMQTQRFVEVIALLTAGRLAEARQRWLPLLPLIEALFAEANPGPLKALLAHHGEMANVLRAPMTQASAAVTRELIRLSEALPDLSRQ
jgi:4-hydroxy-tetrahydrodipicolinate synthase